MGFLTPSGLHLIRKQCHVTCHVTCHTYRRGPECNAELICPHVQHGLLSACVCSHLSSVSSGVFHHASSHQHGSFSSFVSCHTHFHTFIPSVCSPVLLNHLTCLSFSLLPTDSPTSDSAKSKVSVCLQCLMVWDERR